MADETKKEEQETAAEETKEQAAAQETTEEVAVPEKFQKLVSEIEEMSVLDLSELVKVLEKKFGVSAAAPMMMAGGAAGGGEAAAEEESTTASVELTDAGSNKIGVIKALREVTELGLKEAKDLADGAPSMVKEGVEKAEAEEMKKKLEEAGATVTLK